MLPVVCWTLIHVHVREIKVYTILEKISISLERLPCLLSGALMM